MSYQNKYTQICEQPPAILYGGTHIEPLASIGMSEFFHPDSCELKEDISILDYGCGAGILSNYISGQLQRFKYYGLEPNSIHGRERISLAKQYFNDSRCQFGFIDSDFSNTIKEKIDIIVLISVFTHMIPEDIERVLHELSEVFEYNPTCNIVFSCFIDEQFKLINFQPHIWERFYGESYITLDFLKNICSSNNLKFTHHSEFVAQGNYKHQIIKVSKL